MKYYKYQVNELLTKFFDISLNYTDQMSVTFISRHKTQRESLTIHSQKEYVIILTRQTGTRAIPYPLYFSRQTRVWRFLCNLMRACWILFLIQRGLRRWTNEEALVIVSWIFMKLLRKFVRRRNRKWLDRVSSIFSCKEYSCKKSIHVSQRSCRLSVDIYI